jgi:alpha-D-ribose 1-methylphosphonate 5-triphosphate synthase subunit PhnG
VEVVLADGGCVEGAAQVMDEGHRLAENLAVCDAVLRHRLPGCERVEAAVTQGMTTLSQRNRERQAMLASTRVDFSLLDSVDDDED